MEVGKLLEVMHLAEKLKDATRHCYTSGGRHESVADHSWRKTLLAYLMHDEFPEADMDKVIRMCLIHDIGEAFTGDIPSFLKTQEDSDKEDAILFRWVATMDEPFRTEMKELYEEMIRLETLEARIYKCCDKLEAVIQHNESDLETWSGLEYTLNVNYANENVQFSEYLKELREAIRKETLDKINNARVKVIYFDMDGVLADFDRGIVELLHMTPKDQHVYDPRFDDRMFEAIRDYKDFYASLEPIEGSIELLKKLKEKYNVEILTGIPRPSRGIVEARDNKLGWVKKYIGKDITVHTVMRKDKPLYATGANCILIDDFDSNVKRWQEAGGTAVRFTTAAEAEEKLKKMGIL